MRTALKVVVPGLLARVSGVEWLLKASFNGPDLPAGSVPASLGAPYVDVGEPLAVVQNDGQFSISDGRLSFPAQATPTWGDQGFYGAAVTRKPGRALFGKVAYSFREGWLMAFASSQTLNFASNNNVVHGFYFNANPNVSSVDNTTGISFDVYFTDTEYQMAIVLRSVGAYYFIKGGNYADWTLVAVRAGGVATSLYPAVSNLLAASSLDHFAVRDLPAPFNVDYRAHMRLDGARAAGDTFWHPANFRLEYTATALPSSNSLDVYFARADAANYYFVRVTSSGALTLREVVAGGLSTELALSGTSVVNGDKISVTRNGAVISVYVNGARVINYTSANNNAGKTNTIVAAIGPGAAISDLRTYPLYPTKDYTDALPGARAAGETFRHEADGRISWTATTLPGSSSYAVFRKQDSQNYWYFGVNYLGVAFLYEVVAGTLTLRGSAGGVQAGHNLTAVFQGSAITVYSNGQQRISYASAVNFQMATVGEIFKSSQNDGFSDLYTYPATLPVTSATTGLATTALLGRVNVGETFTHEADCLLEWVQNVLPATGTTTNIYFRGANSVNFWLVQCNVGGTLTLVERVNNADTARGIAGTVVSAGHRIVVHAVGNTIRVYSNNTLRITYASAENFKTATQGELNTLGTGGEVRDLIAWPYSLPPAAAAELSRGL